MSNQVLSPRAVEVLDEIKSRAGEPFHKISWSPGKGCLLLELSQGESRLMAECESALRELERNLLVETERQYFRFCDFVRVWYLPDSAVVPIQPRETPSFDESERELIRAAVELWPKKYTRESLAGQAGHPRNATFQRRWERLNDLGFIRIGDGNKLETTRAAIDYYTEHIAQSEHTDGTSST